MERRKYLTVALATVVAASMSMTALAAGSTRPGAGSLSPNTPGVVEDGADGRDEGGIPERGGDLWGKRNGYFCLYGRWD